MLKPFNITTTRLHYVALLPIRERIQGIKKGHSTDKHFSSFLFFIFSCIHDSCVVTVTQKSGVVRPVFILYIHSVVQVYMTSENKS